MKKIFTLIAVAAMARLQQAMMPKLMVMELTL